MTYFVDSLFSPSLVPAGLAASAFSELALGGAVGFVSALGTVVEGAGRWSNSSFDGLGSRELAVLFEELFTALPLTSCGERPAGVRLEASSPAVRASVAVGVDSPVPFVLGTLAVEVVDSATAAGGVAKEAVFTGAFVV